MGKMWEKGKAELAAYGRYGLQDAQRLVMGEWHGSTPASPGMAGTITPAEADRQLNDPQKEEPQMEEAGVRPPEPQEPEREEPEKEEEMEMG